MCFICKMLENDKISPDEARERLEEVEDKVSEEHLEELQDLIDEKEEEVDFKLSTFRSSHSEITKEYRNIFDETVDEMDDNLFDDPYSDEGFEE